MEAGGDVAEVPTATGPVLAQARIPTSCLLCWKPLADSGARDLDSQVSQVGGTYLEFEGAEGVEPLNKRLTQWLILRKLLGVTPEWCRENVFRGSGAPEEADEEWFRVCNECLHSCVREVWFIHRQIGSLERRVEEIRLQVKKKMRNGATKTNQAREAGGISSRIRGLLVPEMGEMMEAPAIQNATVGSSEPPEEDDNSQLAKAGAGSCSGVQDAKEEEVGHNDSSAEVRRHWKRHREEGTFSWKCDNCDKVYSARKRLRDHQRRRHHENMEGRTCPHCHPRSWSCAECNVAPFTNVEDFRGHQRLHRKRKQLRYWACHVCGKYYLLKSTLQLHLKRKHSGKGYRTRPLEGNREQSGVWRKQEKPNEHTVNSQRAVQI